MNKDIIKRFMKAHNYQMKAIKAILPDCAADKIDNIGDQIKEIAMECMMELWDEEKGSGEAKKAEKKVKKVDIG